MIRVVCTYRAASSDQRNPTCYVYVYDLHSFFFSSSYPLTWLCLSCPNYTSEEIRQDLF